MEKGQLVVFKAELLGQLAEINKVYQRIDERAKAKTQIEVESLAFWLHNLYSAFEDLFEMITRFFENNITNKEHYHIELLKRMTIPIHGVRPQLLTEKTFILLDHLRAFRHVIRHAYVYDVDERQVCFVFDDAIQLKSLFHREVNNFIEKLK